MIVGGKPVEGPAEGIVEEEIGDNSAEDRLLGDEIKGADRQSGDDRIEGFVNSGEDRQSGDDRIDGFDTSLDQSGDDR